MTERPDGSEDTLKATWDWQNKHQKDFQTVRNKILCSKYSHFQSVMPGSQTTTCTTPALKQAVVTVEETLNTAKYRKQGPEHSGSQPKHTVKVMQVA